MMWSPTVRRGPETFSVHLAQLAEQLGDLAHEIRASVAGLAGNSIGSAVRDVLLRFWSGRVRTIPSQYREEDYSSRWPADEWERSRGVWPESPARAASKAPAPTSIPRLALALQAGGWLLQHGSLVSLAGVGAAVGGVYLLRGPLGTVGFDLLGAVAEVAALVALLGSASKQLILP